jgi:predicted DNA-binding WGR domain protein
MSELCHITLVAIHPERNIRRSYRLSLGCDLFGDWTVELRYGRIGQRGQERRIVCHSLEEARRLARAYLRRRMSAPRRIGCPYRIASFDPGQTDLLSSALPIGLTSG